MLVLGFVSTEEEMGARWTSDGQGLRNGPDISGEDHEWAQFVLLSIFTPETSRIEPVSAVLSLFLFSEMQSTMSIHIHCELP